MTTIQELKEAQSKIQDKYKEVQSKFEQELKKLEVEYIKIDGKIELLQEQEK